MGHCISYLFGGLLVPFLCAAQTAKWPVVRPVHGTYEFSGVATGRDAPVDLRVRDLAGEAVYKVECHNGNFKDDLEILFSGDFQCALFAMNQGRRVSWNLLATDEEAQQRSDWLNRGRMLSAQLWGGCGDVLEYGKVRHFRLRGMQITLRFLSLEWLPETDGRYELRRFTFDVTVVPDPSADSSTAARVSLPLVLRGCEFPVSE